jgi:hypothetical protein
MFLIKNKEWNMQKREKSFKREVPPSNENFDFKKSLFISKKNIFKRQKVVIKEM